jgi:AdoMet-dependent heme synthase
LWRMSTLFTRHNLAAFPELCRRLAAWGVEQVTFNQLGGNDRPEFHRDHALTVDQAIWLARMLPAWRAELAAIGQELRGGAAYTTRILASTRGERIAVDDCGPGTRTLFIDEAGRVSPCSFTGARYGLSIDELEEPGALAGLASRWREARASGRDPACDDCHQTNVFEKFARGAA